MDSRLFSLADEQLFPDLRGHLGASLDQLERYAKVLKQGRKLRWNFCCFRTPEGSGRESPLGKEKCENYDKLAPSNSMHPMMSWRGEWLEP